MIKLPPLKIQSNNKKASIIYYVERNYFNVFELKFIYYIGDIDLEYNIFHDIIKQEITENNFYKHIAK